MTVHTLLLYNCPIYAQLQIEEALLRSDERNILLINSGSPPAVVMGISGKEEELIDEDKIDIPVIRRFSGGGTVVVDENTLFVTFIFDPQTLAIKPYPESLLRWTEEFYKPLFPPHFSLQAQDYTLSDKKIGGNAQYIRKNRLLHHTTFLWDYNETLMQCLKMPPKTPLYRQNRSHSQFLDRLKHHFSSKDEFLSAIQNRMQELFPCQPFSQDELESILQKPHRQATQFLAQTSCMACVL